MGVVHVAEAMVLVSGRFTNHAKEHQGPGLEGERAILGPPRHRAPQPHDPEGLTAGRRCRKDVMPYFTHRSGIQSQHQLTKRRSCGSHLRKPSPIQIDLPHSSFGSLIEL